MPDERRTLLRREFLSLLGFALLAAACGRRLSQASTTTVTGGAVTSQGPRPTLGAPPTPPRSTTAPPTTAPSSTTSPPTATTRTMPVTTTTPSGPAALRIESRGAWGARDTIGDLLVPHSGPMKYLTVHHAGGNKDAQGVDRYQIWQNYHMDSKGWGDIAYHYIIHRDGTVYEARDTKYRGDTATSYNTDRHFLVVVEGSFNDHHPTTAQLDRLPVVLAWAAQAFGTTTNFVGGHRDYAPTSCPGDNLYPLIADGTLKGQVDAILADGGVRLT